jgi:hypothetical protein
MSLTIHIQEKSVSGLQAWLLNPPIKAKIKPGKEPSSFLLQTYRCWYENLSNVMGQVNKTEVKWSEVL